MQYIVVQNRQNESIYVFVRDWHINQVEKKNQMYMKNLFH